MFLIADDRTDLRWKEADEGRLDSMDAVDEVPVAALGKREQLRVARRPGEDDGRATAVDDRIDEEELFVDEQRAPSMQPPS